MRGKRSRAMGQEEEETGRSSERMVGVGIVP